MWLINLLLTMAVALAQTQPPPETSTWDYNVVRADMFAGFAGDSDRFAKAMAACERMLARHPKHPEALVWHGSGLFLQAGQAFQKGDMAKGGPLWEEGMAEMNEAVALAPDALSVVIPRGAVLLQASRFVPTAMARPILETALRDSIDYLLKPIDADRLGRALDKLERLARQPRRDVRALARELAAELAPGRRIERLASRVGERTTILDVARVTHFFSKDKLTFAVSNGRDHVIDYTLAELEERLDPRRFLRIHRAVVANLAFVGELYPGVDGMVVRLKDERRSELNVARDRVRDLKDRLGI